MTQANLTISGITVVNRTYDGTTNATINTAGISYGGLIGGDIFGINTTNGVFDNKNVGTAKTVTLTNTYTGADAGNYTLTDQTTALANISAKTITVSGITAANKTYDGTTAATINGSGVTFSGIVSGDNLALASVSGSFSDKDVGVGKTVSLNSSYGGTDVGNYSFIDQANTTANISQASLNIAANNATKVYDSLAYTGGNGVQYSGFVNGETAAVLGGSLVYSGSSQNAVNVGTYVITPSNVTSNNYNITFTNGQLTVSKATLTYTSDAIQFNTGETVPVLSGNVSGLLGSDTLLGSTSGTALWITTAISTSPAGNYAINGSGLTSTNYQFVQAPGNANALTITNASDELPFITAPVLGVTASTFVNPQPSVIGGSYIEVLNADTSTSADNEIRLVSASGSSVTVNGEKVGVNIEPKDEQLTPNSVTDVSVLLENENGVIASMGDVVVKSFGPSKFLAEPTAITRAIPVIGEMVGEIKLNVKDSAGNNLSYTIEYAGNGLMITPEDSAGYQLIQANPNLIFILAMDELLLQNNINIEDIEIIIFMTNKQRV